MKKLFPVFVILSVLLFASSCSKVDGAGPVVKEEIAISPFKKLTLEVPATVYYSPGPVRKLEIEAQQNIINVIKADVFNQELVLSVRPNTNIRTHQPIKIFIQAPALTGLYTFSGNIKVTEAWQPERLSLGIGGSGDIFIEEVQTLMVSGRINGSGKIRIEGGFSGSAHLNISGSGNIDLEHLATDSVYAKISGSGSMKVAASKYLNADISGSGTVMYKGSPVIQSKVSGSGTVVKF